MADDQKIDIGEKALITPIGKEGYTDTYASRIEDIIETEKLLLSYPTDKGTMLPLTAGDVIKVTLIKNDGVYSFTQPIIEKILSPIPLLEIDYPQEIVRAQRRKYFRLSVNVEVMFCILPPPAEHRSAAPKSQPKMEKGTIQDLSAGGCYLVTNAILERADRISLNFTLPNGANFNCINGKIARKGPITNRDLRYYGLEFTEISEKSRDKIISYIFDIQRKSKKS